jgi:DMSO/TMAO reductase YedYZ molybdopterin-dependent catalytic subunit
VTTTRKARLWQALAGVLALGVGLGLAELVAGLLNRTSTPIIAVGEGFIELTPEWLKQLAIDLFGTNDKNALVVGMLIVLTVLAGMIGVLAARNLRAGITAAVLLLGVAAFAVWTRPDRETVDLVPTVVAGVAALIALTWLIRRAPGGGASAESAGDELVGDAAAAPDTSRPAVARRSFLAGAAVVAGAGALAGGFGRWLSGRRLEVESSRDTLATEVPLPEPVTPDGVEVGVPLVRPWRTSNDNFYLIDTALAEPLIRAEDWELRIHGQVRNEVRLRYDDLVGMGLEDHWITLNCVSNQVGGSLIGNALWTGVPIARVLELAGPSGDADAVKSTSDDGWTAGTPLGVLTDLERPALLAVGMNGEPLPVAHGFPVRIVVPGLYGYVSATKWVVDLEVTRFEEFEAYWTSRGWAERGPVKVSSRIDVPAGGSVEGGIVTVAGSAWAQHRGIVAVEVRVDEGEWRPADLAEAPTANTWVQWKWDWDATSGGHTLEVRATTADGEVQTGERVGVIPDGATGWHSVTVDVS